MSDIDFKNLDYLQCGNQKQQRIFTILKQYKVMELLGSYDPVLIGTFPIDIAVEGSDLDIACCFKDKAEFVSTVRTAFGKEAGFELAEVVIGGLDTVVVNFDVAEFPIELFAQQIPTMEQNGYRHMLIEYAILKEKGEVFRQEVIKLKKAGVKTESAFAQLLELESNPYDSLLNYRI